MGDILHAFIENELEESVCVLERAPNLRIQILILKQCNYMYMELQTTPGPCDEMSATQMTWVLLRYRVALRSPKRQRAFKVVYPCCTCSRKYTSTPSWLEHSHVLPQNISAYLDVLPHHHVQLISQYIQRTSTHIQDDNTPMLLSFQNNYDLIHENLLKNSEESTHGSRSTLLPILIQVSRSGTKSPCLRLPSFKFIGNTFMSLPSLSCRRCQATYRQDLLSIAFKLLPFLCLL
jgi:hypothetical protein